MQAFKARQLWHFLFCFSKILTCIPREVLTSSLAWSSLPWVLIIQIVFKCFIIHSVEGADTRSWSIGYSFHLRALP